MDKKIDKALQNLKSRQNYLVVQSNDLAQAFGNLSATEHKMLDYATSFITKNSTVNDQYTCDIKDILRHFGWNASGKNYERVVQTFHSLNKKDNLAIQVSDEKGEQGISFTHLFDGITIWKSGKIDFNFSFAVAPYLIDLRSNYYSFTLSELAQIKSKYTLILMKLWQARRMGDNAVTTISGSLEDWEFWFLGNDRWFTSGRFKRDILNTARDEIETKLNVSSDMNTVIKNKKTIGYEMTIRDNRQVPTIDM